MNTTFERHYKPAKMARMLTDQFGYKVTPSAIRKWDNTFPNVFISKNREMGTARGYSEKDIRVFNMIVVMRNLGYDLEDIKIKLPDITFRQGNYKQWIVEVKSRIRKQEEGLQVAKNFME